MGKLYSEAYSMSSLQGTKLVFSFNFLLSRELVMTVNTPVQEMLLVGSLLAQRV